MKILLISPYFSPAVGGVETHLLDLCKFFEKRKHTVYVRTYKALGTKKRGATNENSKYIKIHRLWWPDFNLVFKLEKYTILRIAYISTGLFLDCFLFLLKNKKNIDVVQIHGFIAALWGVPLAKLFNKRVVVNTHVGFKFTGGASDTMLKRVLLAADKVLVLTSSAKKALQSIKVPAEKISIYHYWVDQNKFKPKKTKKQNKKFNVLFVGRLVKVKGVMTIFKIAQKLKNINFTIIGSGPLTEEVKDESEKLNNIEFLGKVDNTKLPQYYSQASLVLIPSKVIKQTYEEGIPRVMIEALSCGAAVIATPSGGIPDVFDEKIGKLANDDVESLSKTIKFYFQNEKGLSMARRNARPFAMKYFSEANASTIEASLKDG